MFGDYYYVVMNHDFAYKGQNGFWFRGVYFTYDYDISDKFSTRLRVEYNSPDFTKKSANLTPYVKDAYLKLKFEKFSLLLGISPTPTWELIEEFWGYRSVEKTPLDLQKFGSSRDFGIALIGKAGSKVKLGYYLMFGNGEGLASENNKFKKIMGEIHFELPHFFIQIYGDWAEGEGHTDKYTYQGFLGLKTDKFKIGTQYAGQIRQKDPDKQDTYEVASGFLTYNLNEKLTLLLRYDKMFDPSPTEIPYIPFAQAKSNLLIAGIDFKPNELVSFIPNIEYVFYGKNANGKKPGSDLYLRLTFYYKFK